MSTIEEGKSGRMKEQDLGNSRTRESSPAARESRSWRQMSEEVHLGNVQRITAERLLLTQVVQDFWKFSTDSLPFLRDRERSQQITTEDSVIYPMSRIPVGKQNRQLVANHTALLMDEFRAREGLGANEDPIHDSFAQSHLDRDRLGLIVDERKYSILETARRWSEGDALRARKDLEKVISKLHPEQKALIREQEEIESLADRRRIAGDVTFASYLLRRASEQAKQQVPFLKSREQNRRSVQLRNEHSQESEGLQAQFVDAFLDAYRYRELEAEGVNFRAVRSMHWGEEPQNDAELYKFRISQMGDNAEYILGQVDGMRTELSSVKEQIITESADWNEIDINNAFKDTRHTIRKLPKDQQTILEKRTGISPRKVRELVNEWSIPLGGTALHYAASEGVIAGLAAWISTREVVLETLPETARTEYLASTWIGLQVMWYYLMVESAKAQFATLEIDGANLNALAKGAYNLAHDMSETTKQYRPERKKKLKKIASAVTPEFIKDLVSKVGPEKMAVGVGHIGPQAIVDITYTLSAIAGMKTGHLNLDQAFVLGCVANALGGLVEGGYIVGQNMLKNRRLEKLQMGSNSEIVSANE